ncbi:type VI secretion system protein TssA [Pantoea sp. DY-15]|nr:type VI secretion system protein TssA [Pantoea sp. DY-15]
MMPLKSLISACGEDAETLRAQAKQQIALWNNWLQPVSADNPAGEDPTYHDGFQQMQEEVNRLSGADTALICELAENLLTSVTKDIRVAAWYSWARLQLDGEAGLADGLSLMAGLLTQFGSSLHPQRARSREAALRWPAGSRMLDTLSLYPEVTKQDALRIAGALLLIEDASLEHGGAGLGSLYAALENRLLKAGGPDAVVPQAAGEGDKHQTSGPAAPQMGAIASGRELLDQARTLSKYLRDQPGGWLAAHRLMKSLRHDTLLQLPPLSGDGKSRIEPPKADQRAQLKRLWLQQSWQELTEQADSLFSRGGNHFWLDLQWYIHQALTRAGNTTLAAIVQDDLKGLLSRLNGLETLAFSDGTPFADEVTLGWIQQQVMNTEPVWGEGTSTSAGASNEDDILQLESEAVELADREGIETALNWLQHRPGTALPRQQWLLRLLMARVAEQFGRQEMALHLLGALDNSADDMTLGQWEPSLLFEVKSRRLKLLRARAGRSEADKARVQPEMEQLLAGLVDIDAARAVVLLG